MRATSGCVVRPKPISSLLYSLQDNVKTLPWSDKSSKPDIVQSENSRSRNKGECKFYSKVNAGRFSSCAGHRCFVSKHERHDPKPDPHLREKLDPHWHRLSIKRCGSETLVNGSMEKETNYLGNTICCSTFFELFFRIRSLLDTDSLVRCTNIRILHYLSSKNSKKTLDFYCFDFLWLFISIKVSRFRSTGLCISHNHSALNFWPSWQLPSPISCDRKTAVFPLECRG